MAASNLTPDCPVTDDILQCPLCLHQLETPVTLKQCLHTFCKECLDEIPQITQDDIAGLTCPRCDKFSSTEEVELNDFLQKLLQARNNDGKDPVECKYCHSKTEINWQCIDCRIELCAPCSVNHVNIPLLKKHSIVTFEADRVNPTIVDELLFCPTHEERMLEFNCKMCEEPLCVLCKVENHDTHTTETVSTALSRLTSEVEQKSGLIEGYIQHLEAKINVVRSKMEDTKRSYAESRDTVHERIKYLITKLREIETQQEEILVKEEKEMLKKLENIKFELEAKIKENKQLLKMTSVTTTHAKNASLLQQYQRGLLEKLRANCEIQSKLLIINISWHTLDVSLTDACSDEELKKTIGNLKQNNVVHKITRDGQVLDNHYMCQNISTCVEQISKTVRETVDLPGLCNRISTDKSTIYVPLSGSIALYDFEGNLTTQIEVPFYAMIVKRLPNHQILVGSRSGLYLYDSLEPNVEAVHLGDGKYSDIDIYGNIVHVLKCDTSEIVTLQPAGSGQCKNINTIAKVPWITECTIQLSCISEAHNCNTFRRVEDTFIVCSVGDRCLFICDLQGTVLKSVHHGKQMLLCGVDRDENVMVAMYDSRIFLSYNLKDGKETILSRSPLTGKPRDLLLDEARNLWVLMQGESSYKLLKFNHAMP